MIDDPIFNELRERSWRKELTGDEEAALRDWLAKHPEAQPDWEAETALNEALRRLPDVPLSNNFTSRVVQAVHLQKAAELKRKRRVRLIWLGGIMWKLGVAGIAGAAGFFCYEQVHSTRLRTQIGQSVAKVSAVTSLPSAEILENFEAIRLSATPAADEKLLSLLE